MFVILAVSPNKRGITIQKIGIGLNVGMICFFGVSR